MPDDFPPMAVLLKEARSAYGAAIHREVARRGLTPLPPQGAFVVVALHHDLPLVDILRERGRAMERAHTLEALVASGYVIDDPMGLRLSERGHDCAHCVLDATGALNAELVSQLGEEGFAALITGLITLIKLKEAAEEEAAADSDEV